ncbi:hypothetical protein CSUI_001977 [Cystoisospora suis]|uniref:Uncharacterized protein n=1 Tax=Cystoisospora suis TaxID=483139 RepID=A0A2C6L9V0_9APIC|nr:hypothetical protein CSUI_001977 [Cystoisospora suis]
MILSSSSSFLLPFSTSSHLPNLPFSSKASSSPPPSKSHSFHSHRISPSSHLPSSSPLFSSSSLHVDFLPPQGTLSTLVLPPSVSSSSSPPPTTSSNFPHSFSSLQGSSSPHNKNMDLSPYSSSSSLAYQHLLPPQSSSSPLRSSPCLLSCSPSSSSPCPSKSIFNHRDDVYRNTSHPSSSTPISLSSSSFSPSSSSTLFTAPSSSSSSRQHHPPLSLSSSSSFQRHLPHISFSSPFHEKMVGGKPQINSIVSSSTEAPLLSSYQEESKEISVEREEKGEDTESDFREFRGSLIWRRCMKCLHTTPDDVWNRLRDRVDLILERGLKHLYRQVEEKTQRRRRERRSLHSSRHTGDHHGEEEEEERSSCSSHGDDERESDPYLEVLRHPVIQKVTTERIFLSNLALYRMWLDRYQVLAPPSTCQCGYESTLLRSSSSSSSSLPHSGSERDPCLQVNEEDTLDPLEEEEKAMKESLEKRREALAQTEEKVKKSEDEEKELQTELEKLLSDIVRQNRQNVRLASKLAYEEKYLQGLSLIPPTTTTAVGPQGGISSSSSSLSAERFSQFLEESQEQTEGFANLIDDVKRRCQRLATIASCFVDAAEAREIVSSSSLPCSPPPGRHRRKGGTKERLRPQREEGGEYISTSPRRQSLSSSLQRRNERKEEEEDDQGDGLFASSSVKKRNLSRIPGVEFSSHSSLHGSREIASPGVHTPGLSIATPLTGRMTGAGNVSPLMVSSRRKLCNESEKRNHLLTGISTEFQREQDKEEREERKGEKEREREIRKKQVLDEQEQRSRRGDLMTGSLRRRNDVSEWRDTSRKNDLLRDEEEEGRIRSSTPTKVSFRRAVTPQRTGERESSRQRTREAAGVYVHSKQGVYTPGGSKRHQAEREQMGEGPGSVIASQGSQHSSSSFHEKEDGGQRDYSSEEFLSVRGDDSPLRSSLVKPLSSIKINSNRSGEDVSSSPPFEHPSSSSSSLRTSPLSLSKRRQQSSLRIRQEEEEIQTSCSPRLPSSHPKEGRNGKDGITSFQGVCTPQRKRLDQENPRGMKSSFSVARNANPTISRSEDTLGRRDACSVPRGRKEREGEERERDLCVIRRDLLRQGAPSGRYKTADTSATQRSLMLSSRERRKDNDATSDRPSDLSVILKRRREGEEEKDIRAGSEKLSRNRDGREKERETVAEQRGDRQSLLEKDEDDSHTSWIDMYLQRKTNPGGSDDYY